jgi:hypothetical protein
MGLAALGETSCGLGLDEDWRELSSSWPSRGGHWPKETRDGAGMAGYDRG